MSGHWGISDDARAGIEEPLLTRIEADTALLEACQRATEAMLTGLHWHDRKREAICPACEDSKAVLARLNERLEENNWRP